MPPADVAAALRSGLVIPAHPLALTPTRRLDERRQRALTRYYHAAGAGGIAVGVHTTQFAIRNPEHGLFRPVLELAAETVAACDHAIGRKTVRVAGICGPTRQAVGEAELARSLGYHVGLLSLSALRDASDTELLNHCRAVAGVLPLFGFYLQPAVGGRVLSRGFWRQFAEIPNVVAIKMAPFNRYQTLDVIRAVAESGRADDITLYTEMTIKSSLTCSPNSSSRRLAETGAYASSAVYWGTGPAGPTQLRNCTQPAGTHQRKIQFLLRSLRPRHR